MTNPELIAQRLAFIETCVSDLRTHARIDDLETDILQQRFVERTLHIAAQAAIDVASHVVSDERAGEPRASRDVFLALARRGILPEDLAKALAEMAGFRNILVHAYTEIDLEKVRRFLTDDLDDLLAFAAHIRTLLR